jgi:hypothetical protein
MKDQETKKPKFTKEMRATQKKINASRRRFSKLAKLQNYIVRHFGYDGLVVDCLIKLKNGKTIFYPINIQEVICLEGMSAHVDAELTLESALPVVPSLYDFLMHSKNTPAKGQL